MPNHQTVARGPGKGTPVTRETLYEEVWAEPMITVAARYGVSSSFLARACTRLNVPRPARGYWAKLAVGQTCQRPPLPPVRPGGELEWSRDGAPRRAPRALPQPPPKGARRRIRARSDVPGEHGLLAGAREHFDAARGSDNGYLKPQKRLLVDLIVSKDTLTRGLATANAFFLALEERGHRVVFAPRDESFSRADVDPREHEEKVSYCPTLWRPYCPTLVYIGTVAIGLTIVELAESVEVRWVDGKYVRVTELPAPKRRRYAPADSWTPKQDMPSGKLCLQAYSPYQGTQWKRQWRESTAGDLHAKFTAIVRELEREAANIAKLVEEARRQGEVERRRWEERQQVWRREEEARQRAQTIKDSREELFAIIDAWAVAKRIDEFFQDVEQRAASLPDEDRSAVLDRVKRARELLGGIDALRRFRMWRAPDER